MNKLKNIFTIFLLFIIFYIIFKYNYIINTSVIDSVKLWITKVFPSLFIMFIINDIIINTNILNVFTKYLNPIFNKVFNTTGNSVEVFLLSIFSGTPSAAFIINEMLINKKISLNDANKLISFTYFTNPLFLYNILTITFNTYITIKIMLIHYLSNIIIGLIYRKKINFNKNIFQDNELNIKNILFILPNSIKKSINTLLMILGTITFYMIISNLLINIFDFSLITNLLIKGFLEITQSLNILYAIKAQSIIKEIIATAIISFGGLSIHTQVISITSDTKISYKNFFIGRILHVLISTSAYIFISFWTFC